MPNPDNRFQQLRDGFRNVGQAFDKVEGARLIPSFSSTTEEEYTPDPEQLDEASRFASVSSEETWARGAESDFSDDFTRDFRDAGGSLKFTHFVDGSVRSVRALDGVANNLVFPIVIGQIGAASVIRDTQNKPMKHRLETDIGLLLPLALLSDTLKIELENLLEGTFLEGKVHDPFDHPGTDHPDEERDYTKLRQRASRRAKDLMVDIERKVLEDCVEDLPDETGLVVLDGSLFSPLKEAGEGMPEDKISRVIGISKSFSMRPLIEIEKDLGRSDCISRLLDLKEGERTDAIELHIQRDWVVTWYQRIRPSSRVESPLDGIVKVETHFADYSPYESENEPRQFEKDWSKVWDEIANTVYAERFPIPFHEQRWHTLLYPINCCERLLKSSFFSFEVLRGLCSRFDI